MEGDAKAAAAPAVRKGIDDKRGAMALVLPLSKRLVQFIRMAWGEEKGDAHEDGGALVETRGCGRRVPRANHERDVSGKRGSGGKPATATRSVVALLACVVRA